MSLLFLFCSLFYQNETVNIDLKAPATAAAGTTIEVSWSPVREPNDFITIVPKDTPEGTYKAYKYAKLKAAKMMVPDTAGAYEIRYLQAQGPYTTLARKPLTIMAVTAELQVPATVDAGAAFSIQWSGPDNERDFITIVKTGTPERKYGKYVYTKRGNPAELKAPDQAGDYEVRYLTGQQYHTLAGVPVKVEAVSASLSAPAEADAGSTIQVSWTGPDHQGDFITIVEAGSAERHYDGYVYTRKGNPVGLTTPGKAGNYEIRYLTGGDYIQLAAIPIRVGAVTATVQAPAVLPAGGSFSASWKGPDNQGDFLTIVKSGAKEGSYDKYTYTQKGAPMALLAPEEPGKYELRYVTARDLFTLGFTVITVEPVTASLKAADSVKGGEPVAVAWTGPGNPLDFIAFTGAGSPDRQWPVYRYTHQGNPTLIPAPLEPGDYELRYLTGQQYRILARRPIRVEPPEQLPGSLRVVLADSESTAIAAGSAVELILDASGSMLQRLGGKRRIEIAKAVLTDLIRHGLPAGTPIALRVFGHKEADSCRTDLEQPLGPLRAAEMAARIKSINAMNLAKTPLADSLELVASDLAGVRGQRIVVLITDGEETCGGDPAASIERLRASGIDIRINIVGFAIDDDDLKQAFRLWAGLGGGTYFDADSADALDASLAEALRIPYDLLDGQGRLVGKGLVGGEAIQAPAGAYTVKTRETPPRKAAVKIPAGGDATAVIKNP